MDGYEGTKKNKDMEKKRESTQTKAQKKQQREV